MKSTPQTIKATLDKQGHEVPSDKPIALPTGMKRPETLQEQISRLVRHEQFAQAVTGDQDEESFDEADDFEVGEDFDPSSPYETVFDPIIQRDVSPAEFHHNSEEYRKLYEAAAKAAIPDPPKEPDKPSTPATPENSEADGD